ncbi:hypothetical protein [Aminipila terrae]|uniref:hypothetical protein n=1 Tax=Aminipila terrae TaxID=2697030 RepID=UPI001FAC64BB|nr:hypothetical protein [Aminipila terrae]
MIKHLKLFLILVLTCLLFAACSNNGADKESEQLTDDTTKATVADKAESNIAQQTKEYILKGQEDIPEARQLQWSETFLNQVDIDAIYKKYIADGGKKDDIKSFAAYLTQNAPTPDNWQEMVKSDIAKDYDEKVSKIELLQDDLYQVYIEKDGSEIPYVVVNSRTGYYHG